MASFKEYQMLFQLNASLGSGYNATFQAGQNAVNKLQGEINALNKSQADIASYQKQQSAIEKTKAKLERYKAELQNLQSVTGSTAKETAELKNKILEKEAQIDSTNKKLDEQNEKLSETGQALRKAGVNTSDLASESERLKAEAASVARAQTEEAQAADKVSSTMAGLKSALAAVGAEKGLQALYQQMKSCSEEAAAYETAMASVKRTVGGDDAFIAELGANFKELSTTIPITASELASIASTAGQLGIAQDDVDTFTTVMAQLATTTDLTAENAATMLAQFANITGLTEYDRLGAVVASLGDATATTASKVVEMSQGMAAAANIAGMSETDILAIAAAVGSLGIEASSGSTAMSTIISTLYKATETGDKLQEFASVAGMSASEFKTAWGVDAVGALDAFIKGLNDTERNGKSAVVILDELGINNVRQTKAILGLASAGNLLTNTVAQANQAWEDNTALTEKAEIMYDTTEAKLTMLQNAANNVSIAFGDALNPAVGDASTALTGILEPIAEFISDNPAVVQGLTVTAGALGVATAAVAAYEAKVKLAALASQLFSSAVPGVGWIVGGAVALGTLTTALGLLAKAGEDSTASLEELQTEYKTLSGSIAESDNILDLVEQYKSLSSQMEEINSTEIIVNMKQQGYEDVTALMSDLGAKVVSAQNELDSAKGTLTELQGKAADLQEAIDGTKKWDNKTRNALTDQLNEVNAQIETQKNVVQALENTHGDLISQYENTAAAAAELNSKEAELKATKEEIASLTGIVISGSDEETKALIEQAAAAEELNKALKLQQLYANLDSQGKKYAEVVADITEKEQKYSSSVRLASVSQEYAGKSAEEINSSYQSLLTTLDEMQEAAGFNPDDAGFQATIDKVEALRELFSGYSDDLNQYAGDMISWVDSFSYLSTNEDHWRMTLEDLNGAIIEYKTDLDAAKSTQNEFLESMASSVLSGATSIQEIETRLTAAWKDEENSAELVAGVVEYVSMRLQEQEEAAKAAAEANELLAESGAEIDEASQKQIQTVNETIQKIEDLKKAYEEAYQAAYDSMGGKFDLFEKVDRISASRNLRTTLAGYTAGLESQTKYMEDYADNYEAATKAVQAADESAGGTVASSFMAQLADGTAESAHILANIAAAAPEDVKAIVEAYAEAQRAREEYAASIAEAQTDFTNEMSALQEELSTTVQAMDFSSEAAQNAKSSLDAFVSAADSYIGKAAAAYRRVARAAANALSFNPTYLPGYASGTTSAESGVALVGEHGPELVNFKGGETVMNAAETAKAISALPLTAHSSESGSGSGTSGETHNQVNVSVQIDAAGLSAEELTDVITGTLAEKLEGALDEIAEDRERRSFA